MIGGGPQEPAKPEAYSHPGVASFHIGVKVAVFLTYLFCGLFNSKGFVVNFVVIILLQAVDFWFVKNVSGRKLIGLRYWNHTNEAGENEWHFESRDTAGMEGVQRAEKVLFWGTLYAMPLLWGLFAFIALITLKLGYCVLCVMGILMGSTNVVGFTKSSKEAKAELSAGVSRLATSYAAAQLRGATAFA